MSAKSFLKRHMPTLSRAMASVVHGRFELLPPRFTYANASLHEKIRALFGDQPGFFFEVGANDGLAQSNTAYLEKHLGWHGILVEPLPMLFVDCVGNRPKSTVINACLVAKDFPAPTMSVIYSGLMSTVDDPVRNRLDANAHVEEGKQFVTEARLLGHRFLVPAITASELLDRCGVPNPDFFSLDVEGYELEVLKGIDFERHRPRYFLVEVRDRAEIDAFFAARGYRHVSQWSHHDQLYQDFLHPVTGEAS